MPDSLPLSSDARDSAPVAEPSRRRIPDSQNDGADSEVGTNFKAAGALRLAAPPRDVGRLLASHATDLPGYVDVQRQHAARESIHRWALLRKAGAAATTISSDGTTS